jgi:hypothetical protein
LKTASAIGTSAGSAARLLRADGLAGNDDDGLETAGCVEPGGLAVGAYDEAPQQRRGRVVGVTLELAREAQEVRVELEQVVGGHEPADVGGRAGSESARQRDLRADAKREAIGRREAGEAAHHQVAIVARDAQRGVDGEAPRLLDLQLQVERDGRSEAVEPRPEVGGRGGNADETAALHGGGGPYRRAGSGAARGSRPRWAFAGEGGVGLTGRGGTAVRSVPGGHRREAPLVVLLVTFARKCGDAGAVRQGRSERAMAAPLPRVRTQPGGDRRPAFPVKRCEKGH